MTNQKRKYPFTPGPWIAHTEILTPVGLHVAGRSPSVRKNSHIVAVVGRFLDERLNHAKCPEAEANARLIAAAPSCMPRSMTSCPRARRPLKRPSKEQTRHLLKQQRNRITTH